MNIEQALHTALEESTRYHTFEKLSELLSADNVYNDYKAGKEWQRRAVIETTGFGFGTAAGAFVGGATITAGVGIAIAMGPVGWVILTGAGLGAGYAAGKAGDSTGQAFAGTLYDTSSSISWF